jgi:biofilm PGA synthesis lipoprotein PgaB
LPGVKASDHVNYGGSDLSRDAFLTWAQVREMQASGLVEIASHSSALHKGMNANPQGSKQPFAVTSTYDPATGSYEMVEQYVRRLQDDAAASVRTIKRFTGKAPRAMVWPYGAYNEIGVLVQDRAGMPVTLTLDDGYPKVSALRNVPRALIKNDPDMGDFAVQIRQYGKVAPMRVVQVDLDYVYDPDPEQEARNLDALISRVYALKINTVFLQAFSDPTFQGYAKEVYFPNRFLPVRKDLFNRVAWQLKTRAMVEVYGWLPVLSFDFGADVDQVTKWNPDTNTAAVDPKAYKRVSPYDPEGRRRIIGIYEDMARHAPIDGLLFHDDAMMSDYEDASPSALRAYQAAGFPASIAGIRADQRAMDKWTSFKTETLIGLTKELTAHVSAYRSPIKTVRNIYAAPVINQNSEEWFAQNYDRFLDAYDYTAVEAMPRMENVADADHKVWLDKIGRAHV